MTLRELLKSVHYGEMTDEELLDLEVKVRTEASNGVYGVECGIKDITVEQLTRYSNLKHAQVPLEKNGAPYVIITTTMVP